MLSRRLSGGFSLVEMVAALAIFSISIVATLGIFTVCLRSTGTSVNYTRASFLAQGLMEEMLAEQEFTPGDDSGDFGAALPDATWTRELVETETIGLYEVQVRVIWTEHENQRLFELVTLAAER